MVWIKTYVTRKKTQKGLKLIAEEFDRAGSTASFKRKMTNNDKHPAHRQMYINLISIDILTNLN